MTFLELVERIWRFENQDLGEGATDEEIAAAERTLGVQLDGGYRHFLHKFGWGGVEHLELYGLGSGVPIHLDLVRVTQSERGEMAPQLQHHLVPVMNDGGGNLYCLDTSRKPEPAIVFWDHTARSDQNLEVEAGDFTQWLSQEIEELE